MKINKNSVLTQWLLHRWSIGWIDIGTGTRVPLRFVTYLSKVMKINENSVLTQWLLHPWPKYFGSCTI
jgi:hypothetical protein